MGKRSTGTFERRERDYYPTPDTAVWPLLPHLLPHTYYIEPCFGEGKLIEHLDKHEHICYLRSDIDPKFGYWHCDATKDNIIAKLPRLSYHGLCFITNPPWDREILHPIIQNLSAQLPTWLLFDADWMHTKQSIPYLPYLRKIVSVGRVKWIPESTMTGKDNCCWYLFDQNSLCFDEPIFYGRR